KIAFEDSGDNQTPGRILVGSVPSQANGCQLPAAGAAQILDDARQPDWGPANVPTPPRVDKPLVTTGTASDISATNAKIAGTVDPEGARTTYRFQYGKTTSYGSDTEEQSAS